MAYTIKPRETNNARLQRKLDRIRAALFERMEKDGRFNARILYADNCLHIANVRLTRPKEYCGQHPGPCQLTGRKKPRGTWLEWDDWVAFNTMVNRVLNRLRMDADVWTRPREIMDRGSKFWIRRGRLARKRWDWENRYNYGFGRPVQVWNHGTPDQFEVAHA